MKSYSRLFTGWGLLLMLLPLQGQELRPLQYNPVVKEQVKRAPLKKNTLGSDTIKTLPFFDDFSNLTVFPNPALWADRYAFINNTFPVDPISYGVATLDAVDDKGDVYPASGSADFLTSLPIKMEQYAGYPDGIRLSFFHQPGGYGEPPESKDSLVLEFYRPDTENWHSVWRMSGSKARSFEQAIVEVPMDYLKDGFRFRFRNYISISPSEVSQGKAGISNLDLWHIDYVRLNTLPAIEHQKVYDISIINNLPSAIKKYQSVPWAHIDHIPGEARISQFTLRIRNNSPFPGNTTGVLSYSRGYYVKEVRSGTFLTPVFDIGSENIGFDTIFQRNDIFIPPLQGDGNPTALIETGAYVETADPAENSANNQVSRSDFFGFHYAYDDGTPEQGFGLSGESVSGSMVVNRYTVFKADSLRAVDILFNKTRDDYTQDLPFRIVVFDSDKGVPGQLPYAVSGESSPDMSLGYLEFQRIPLNTPVWVTDTFFIGIQQFTDEFLNVGYDMNIPAREQIFYNISGTWNTLSASYPNGSLMIRPVLSFQPVSLSQHPKVVSKKSLFSIHPNPASNFLHITFNKFAPEAFEVHIVDLTGRLCLSARNQEVIDLGTLKAGLYLLHINTPGGVASTAKFAVTH